MSAAPVSPPFRGAEIQKALTQRVGLPLGLVQPALRAAKICTRPGQYRRRRALRGTCVPEALRVPEEAGYRRLAPGTLSGAAEVVAHCLTLYEQARHTRPAADFVRNPRKDFLLSILSGHDLADQPLLARFLVARPLLDAVSAYLGEVPVLSAVNLWWSPPNESARHSQLLHADTEDERQLKLFVLVTETRADQGPLTVLAADASRRVRASAPRGMRHFPDELVQQAGLWERVEVLVGPAGSAALVDTSRCLHFGSRANRRDRLVLAAQYLRFHAPAESTQPCRPPCDLPGPALDEVQRLALGLA
jgi:hypothetical protein